MNRKKIKFMTDNQLYYTREEARPLNKAANLYNILWNKNLHIEETQKQMKCFNSYFCTLT